MKGILKNIEIIARHVFVYPFFRLIFRNQIQNDNIDLKSIRKLLILRNDGIGDMIVSTPMFRKLKEAYPQMKLGVVVSPRNADIIRYNVFVDEIYIANRYVGELWRELKRCKAEHYDVVLNFVFNQTTSGGLLANYVVPEGVKVGQGLNKYQTYFNRLLKLERSEKHMVEILAIYVDEVFGTDFRNESLSPEVFIDKLSHNAVDAFLRHHGLFRRYAKNDSGSYVVINYSAIDKVRRMSVEQTVQIVKTIREKGKYIPVIIYPPGEQEKLQRILSQLTPDDALVFPLSGTATLLELASLIEGARYTITCDTSIVHFAAATNTPVFVLFTPTAALNHEWTPYGVVNKCLYARKGSGVDSISLEQIIRELSIFESKVCEYENKDGVECGNHR